MMPSPAKMSSGWIDDLKRDTQTTNSISSLSLKLKISRRGCRQIAKDIVLEHLKSITYGEITNATECNRRHKLQAHPRSCANRHCRLLPSPDTRSLGAAFTFITREGALSPCVGRCLWYTTCPNSLSRLAAACCRHGIARVIVVIKHTPLN